MDILKGAPDPRDSRPAPQCQGSHGKAKGVLARHAEGMREPDMGFGSDPLDQTDTRFPILKGPGRG